MDIEPFRPIQRLADEAMGDRPPGVVQPRMFRQAMIKDKDNNIYAVYGDRLKKGTPGEATKSPWEVSLAGVGTPNPTTGEYSSYKGTVWPGTVAGILPSNIFSDGKLAEFSVGAFLMKWKCECTTNGRQITSCQIVVDQTDPPAQTLVASLLPEKASFVFAVTNGGNVWQIRNQNVTANTDLSLITDKTSPPQPGIPGVDRWYEIKF